MVARANELHHAGVVDRCIELFRIVSQLKEEVRGRRDITWKDYVEKNFTFGLATADNYARIGRTPNALGAGAVRHLHASGRVGYQRPTIARAPKIEASKAVDAEIVAVPESSQLPIADHHDRDERVGPDERRGPGHYRWTPDAKGLEAKVQAVATSLNREARHERLFYVVLLADLVGLTRAEIDSLNLRARS